MPKAGKSKYYAVKIGREGPRIYTDWEQCRNNVSRYPGAVHKSFPSRTQAERWLEGLVQVSFNDAVHPDPPMPVSDHPTPISDKAHPHPNASEGIAPQTGSKTGTDVQTDTAQIKLSAEQKEVLRMVKDGKSVFFTGSAGTGKSVLLTEIIETLGGPTSPTLAITASTGIAAVNVKGTTLHSWAGIGLGQEREKDLANKILYQPKLGSVLQRWRSIQTLIIDEVSMIDGTLFDKLEFIARRLRKSEAPFGGIQLVLSGDFCQLPPVPDRCKGVVIPSKFAFEAETWQRCVGTPVHLTRVFRQKDQAFVDMLNALRFGEMSRQTIERFRNLSRTVVYDDGIDPTELYPTRREVDVANNSRLRRLSGSSYVFDASDRPGIDDHGNRLSGEQMQRLLERLVAAKSLELKVGAQVMLIKNLVQGELVNGSLGKVVKFSTASEAAQVHPEITEPAAPQTHTEITERTDAQSAAADGTTQTTTVERLWPVVRFTNGRELLITPQDFTVNNAEGEAEARREQVPLILAWALSVHKSQGQTLVRIKVDLKRTFENGQAYVALSRATSMETLQVLHFDPAKVLAHPRVLAWYKGVQGTPVVDDFDEMDMDEAITSYHN